MELISRNSFFLEVDYNLDNLIRSVRKEISDAILNAKINRSFNKDVSLSFGKIHINEFGSISPISFNGIGIIDIDKFVLSQCVNISSENYIDLRIYIKDNPSNFLFYPIKYKSKTYYTLLKYSNYFINYFGDVVNDHDRFRIQYTLKYIVVSILKGDNWIQYVFVIDLYSNDHINRLFINDAIRTSGINTKLYYCFSNSRPEVLLRIGQIQDDFKHLKKIYNNNGCEFYKGELIKLIYRIFKKNNHKNEPNVKESRRSIIGFVIQGSYIDTKLFADQKNIDDKSLNNYINGRSDEVRYQNGDKLEILRLMEMLNLTIPITEESLKNRSLLIPVEYKDIPVEVYDF